MAQQPFLHSLVTTLAVLEMRFSRRESVEMA